jgi:hypothetical protein
MDSEIAKKCIKCEQELPMRFFYIQRRKGRSDYYRGKCKMCYSVDRKHKGY